MSRRETPKAKTEFQAGLNHAIHSSEKAEEAGARSVALRAPLYDPEIEGAPTKGRIRPNWVKRHLKRLEELNRRIEEAVGWEKAKEREAAEVPKYWPWLLIVLILIISDGLLLGPVIANAVGGFDNEKLILLMGLGTALGRSENRPQAAPGLRNRASAPRKRIGHLSGKHGPGL